MAASPHAPGTIAVIGNSCTFLSRDLLGFYSIPDNFEVLRSVNDHSPPISLRCIALYVSVAANDSIKKDYIMHLRRLTRKKFDPFRRCDRITLESGSAKIITTEGQMNFFRWLIESGTWTFVVDNAASVVACVARCMRETAEATPPGPPRRASHPKIKTDPVPCGMSVISGKHVVVFD